MPNTSCPPNLIMLQEPTSRGPSWCLLGAPHHGCSTTVQMLQTSRWLQPSVTATPALKKTKQNKKKIRMLPSPCSRVSQLCYGTGHWEFGTLSPLVYLWKMLSCRGCPAFNSSKRKMVISFLRTNILFFSFFSFLSCLS